MVNIYRALIIFSTGVYVFSYFLPYFDYQFYPQDVNDLLNQDGYGSLIIINELMGYVILSIGVLLPVMMFFFIPGSRQLFLISVLVFLILNLALGVRILTGLEVMLAGIVAMSDGAILAIAYLTPISSKFSENRGQSELSS